MAKEEKKQEKVTMMGATEDNIEAALTASKTMSKEAMEAAYKKMADEQNEKLTKEFIRKVRMVEYIKARSVATVRFSNRKLKLAREYNNKLTEILEEVKEKGNLEKFEAIQKAKEEYNDAYRKESSENDKLVESIRNTYEDLRNDWEVRDLLAIF